VAGNWDAEKKAVFETARALSERGLVVGKAGNVSLRLAALGSGRNLLAITPRGKHYPSLTAEEIQIIDFEGEPVEGDLVPSVESMLHVEIFKARPDTNAVIHTHSVFACVLAVSHIELPPVIDELVVHVGGEVKLSPYAFPGTEELAKNAAGALKERNAALLSNHGMVGVGQSLTDALNICEMVERVAQVYVYSSLLGKVNPLPADVVRAEQDLFRMAHRHERLEH